MLFTYTSYIREPNGISLKRELSTNFDEFSEEDVKYSGYIEIYDNSAQKILKILETVEDFEAWRLKLERDFAWKPRPKFQTIQTAIIDKHKPITNSKESDKYKTAISPAHYKQYLDEYEWLDVQARIPRFKNKENFKAALELQVRKYLDRNGRKDDELQEMQKGLFYHIYLVLYAKADKPIKVSDAHQIMDLIHEISVRYRNG